MDSYQSQNPNLPNPYELRKAIIKAGITYLDRSLYFLSSRPNPRTPQCITLAIDGWTGQTYGAKNTNIIALCNGQSYFLWSDRNEDELDSTTDYLLPLIKDKIEYLLSKNILISSITTDNATNMINLGSALYQIPSQGKVILHISCSAHTVQLMIKNIVNLKPIEQYISSALALINPFISKDGKKLRLELHKFQINQGRIKHL